MSIANELSSEIAAALLARDENEDAASRNDLKDVLVEVHSTLCHLTAEARKSDSLRSKTSSPLPPPSSSAASGAN